MIRSMTGFGSSLLFSKGEEMLIEILSLNRRYLDVSVFLPKELSYLELDLRRLVKKYIHRGQVTIRISLFPSKENVQAFLPELVFLKGLKKVLCEVADKIGVTAETIDLPYLLRIADFLYRKKLEKGSENVFLKGVQEAIKGLLKVKEAEGKVILSDIRKRISQIKKSFSLIEKRAPFCAEGFRERLIKRFEELALEIDQEKILKEIVIFSEKLDITEEIVRFNSHLKQLLSSLLVKEAIGKKLDFILQEMIREVSTIAAKSSDVIISKSVIEIKGEIEKIREQVQNVE